MLCFSGRFPVYVSFFTIEVKIFLQKLSTAGTFLSNSILEIQFWANLLNNHLCPAPKKAKSSWDQSRCWWEFCNGLVERYLDKRGEWPSGLRRCSKNRKVPGSNPTRRSAGLRDPTSLRGSRWPSGRKCKTQWLTSGEWGCPLDNGPKLAVGQPNSS